MVYVGLTSCHKHHLQRGRTIERRIRYKKRRKERKERIRIQLLSLSLCPSIPFLTWKSIADDNCIYHLETSLYVKVSMKFSTAKLILIILTWSQNYKYNLKGEGAYRRRSYKKRMSVVDEVTSFYIQCTTKLSPDRISTVTNTTQKY